MQNKLKLSIISTSFNSSKYIENFFEQINNELINLKLINDCEIIIVDDGSLDDSLEKIKNKINIFKNFKIIQFSRNFGHHHAMMCGVKESDGEIIFLIDSDLEEKPSLLKEFYTSMLYNKHDIIIGSQTKRDRGLIDNIFGTLFYKISSLFSENPTFKNECTIRIFNSKVKKAVLEIYEKNYSFLINQLFAEIGFKRSTIKIEKKRINKSNYTLGKKISIISSILVNYSNIMLKLIIMTSIIIFSISVIIILYYFFNYLAGDIGVKGFPSLIISIWFLCGIMMISLSIICTYLSKLLTEVRQRTKYIIKDIIKN